MCVYVCVCVWERNWFPKSINFCAKIDCKSCNFRNTIFAFVDQSAKYLEICGRQHLTYPQKFEGSKPKIILKIFSVLNCLKYILTN